MRACALLFEFHVIFFNLLFFLEHPPPQPYCCIDGFSRVLIGQVLNTLLPKLTKSKEENQDVAEEEYP